MSKVSKLNLGGKELEKAVAELFKKGAFSRESRPNDYGMGAEDYKRERELSNSVNTLCEKFGYDVVDEQVDIVRYSDKGELGQKIIATNKIMRSLLSEINSLEATEENANLAENVNKDMARFSNGFSHASSSIEHSMRRNEENAYNNEQYAKYGKEMDECIKLLE